MIKLTHNDIPFMTEYWYQSLFNMHSKIPKSYDNQYSLLHSILSTSYGILN